MDELDKILNNQEEPIEQPVEWWQLDKIESILVLCPYEEYHKQEILNNPPKTKEDANILLSKLWFDHIPRDPKDQLDKWIKLGTLIDTI